MSTKTKRTYNLSEGAVHRVRELAARADLAASQDGVVELAIERLYLETRARDEAALWDAATRDPEFAAEMGLIGAEFRDGETWPE